MEVENGPIEVGGERWVSVTAYARAAHLTRSYAWARVQMRRVRARRVGPGWWISLPDALRDVRRYGRRAPREWAAETTSAREAD